LSLPTPIVTPRSCFDNRTLKIQSVVSESKYSPTFSRSGNSEFDKLFIVDSDLLLVLVQVRDAEPTGRAD